MCETLQRSGTVRANRKLTDTLFVLDIESPDVAASMQPGQFIHVKIPGMGDHILRRPWHYERALSVRGLWHRSSFSA